MRKRQKTRKSGRREEKAEEKEGPEKREDEARKEDVAEEDLPGIDAESERAWGGMKMEQGTLRIEELKFDENGLIPAVVVDAVTKKVLTVAYMNKESLRISMEKGLTCFWSRSRQELWLKGETSGNYQHIVSITADCDKDALVVTVEKDGPACHTGSDSCFTNPVWHSDKLQEFSLEGLYELLQGRKEELPEGSYTTYLFEKGMDKILKKVGEECTEVIIAGKSGDRKETVYELADLAYHAMVLMVEMGISLEDVHRELASRHVIDHKVKQEKMTQ